MRLIKPNRIKSFALMTFCFFLSIANNSYALQELGTEEEISVDEHINIYIEENIKKNNFDNLLGQIFLVGLPATKILGEGFKLSDDIKKIIVDNSIGSILLHTSNILLDNAREGIDMESTSECIKILQKKSISKSKSKLPLLIAAYHDGIGDSSIPFDSKFMSLPGLTLAATNDEKAIRLAGRLQGFQLQHIGVNMILGPNINTDRPNSRDTFTSHYFAEYPDVVHDYSKFFIDGLNEANLVIMGKYIPGKSAKDTREYDGGTDYCFPSSEFSSILHGAMTSYVKINVLPYKYSSASFSKEFIQDKVRSPSDLQGLGFTNDHVIISADLSDKKMIEQYKKDTESKILSYEKMAIYAFEAGNDMLFFSTLASNSEKITTASLNSKQISPLTTDNIKNILTELKNYIFGHANREKRFKESLTRVLKLKARVINGLCNDGFKGFSALCESKNQINELNSIKEFTGNEEYGSSEEFLESMIKKSMLKINSKRPYSLNELKDKKIAFYVDEKASSLFREHFTKGQPVFIEIPDNKTERWLKNVQDEFFKHIETNNCVVYTVLDKIDANLLKTASEKYPRKIHEKMIIFLHNNPKLLPSELLPRSTIIGCFTKHPLSYKQDIEILNGSAEPQKRSRLTINLGSFYDTHTSRINKFKQDSIDSYNKNYDTLINNWQSKYNTIKSEFNAYKKEKEKELVEREYQWNNDFKNQAAKLEKCYAENGSCNSEIEVCRSNAQKYSKEVKNVKKKCRKEQDLAVLIIVILILMVIGLLIYTFFIINKKGE